MKYDKDAIYSTRNTVKITTAQTGSKAMIQEKGQDQATMRQGFRVIAEYEGEKETLVMGEWNMDERTCLLEAVKREYYAKQAYKELYYDLLHKLNSIGFVQASEIEDYDDRL